MRVETPLVGSGSWSTLAMRWLFDRERRPAKDGDEIVTAFRDGVVTARSNRRVEGFTNAIQEIGYQGVRKGDLVIHSMDGFAGAIGVSDSDGKASPVVHCYRPREGVDPRYFAYMLRDFARCNYILSLAKGIRERSSAFDAETFRSLVVPVPAPSEQRAIADYLDAETTRIDALIGLERRRWVLSEEKVAAAVQCAALGGIAAEKGSSSSEGPLGALPRGWERRRNKTFLREIVELSESGDEELLSVSHITGVTPRSEKEVTMFLAESNEGYKRVKKGDVVVNTMWAWMGALGVSQCDGIVSPAYGVYRFTDERINPKYFDSLFRSCVYIAEMTRFSKGVWSSRLRLYPESFLGLRTPFPPYEEQGRISEQIDLLRSEADREVRLLSRSVELLAERRGALITAAVTGELDIPGLAA